MLISAISPICICTICFVFYCYVAFLPAKVVAKIKHIFASDCRFVQMENSTPNTNNYVQERFKNI